jgi:hypothetical protein
MATRTARIAQFNTSEPPLGVPLEILCEDHNGTYLLPFECHWQNGEWLSRVSGARIASTVLGWRRWADDPNRYLAASSL